MIATLYMDFR